MEREGLQQGLKEATEGRQEADVQATGSGVEVEALRKERNDLHQQPGVAEEPVHSFTSTLSATFSTQQGV